MRRKAPGKSSVFRCGTGLLTGAAIPVKNASGLPVTPASVGGVDSAERTQSTRFLHTSGRADPLGQGRFCGTNPTRIGPPRFGSTTGAVGRSFCGTNPIRGGRFPPGGRSVLQNEPDLHHPLMLPSGLPARSRLGDYEIGLSRPGTAKSCHSLPPPGLPPVRRPILPNEPNSRGRSASCRGDRLTPVGTGVDSTERSQFGRAGPVRGRECRHRSGDRCRQRRTR
ncbi:MAG: hypothetical protein JWO38_5314 [Gemmataceae bacterium]|nr:hypothetical protein [Gemmataceae bacterium]